ncbi:MAG: hypothetical protein GY759_13715 [Chloroflexi bacterium]|nr:hypothetical protein [Chloroflexota bacterium]
MTDTSSIDIAAGKDLGAAMRLHHDLLGDFTSALLEFILGEDMIKHFQVTLEASGFIIIEKGSHSYSVTAFGHLDVAELGIAHCKAILGYEHGEATIFVSEVIEKALKALEYTEIHIDYGLFEHIVREVPEGITWGVGLQLIYFIGIKLNPDTNPQGNGRGVLHALPECPSSTFARQICEHAIGEARELIG